MKATKKTIERRKLNATMAGDPLCSSSAMTPRSPRQTGREPARPRADRPRSTEEVDSRSRVVPVSCAVTAAPPLRSHRVLEVAAMFGLGVDESHKVVIVPPCEIPIPAPGIVFITGPSGSGKSTILRLLARTLTELGESVIDLNAPDPRDHDEDGHMDAGADADADADADIATQHNLIKVSIP